tara:strand:+ start:373 stop:525 length:153 start_codon:yes stop_codon:yes gene_type:complete
MTKIKSFKVYTDDADESKKLVSNNNLDKILEILENNGYIVEVKLHNLQKN